jgi:hypothetical protein
VTTNTNKAGSGRRVQRFERSWLLGVSCGLGLVLLTAFAVGHASRLSAIRTPHFAPGATRASPHAKLVTVPSSGTPVRIGGVAHPPDAFSTDDVEDGGRCSLILPDQPLLIGLANPDTTTSRIVAIPRSLALKTAQGRSPPRS